MPSSLPAALIQVVLACGGCWLLWIGWRRIAGIDRVAGLLVGLGLLIRAVIAQVLFWISHLHLPFGRSLQEGDGFWIFAHDGTTYYGWARWVLEQGWMALALVDKRLPSPVYVQVLATFLVFFGGAASVAALLNLFAFLGVCAAILRLGRTPDGRIATPAMIALAALSFAPSVVLWSVLPLKDPFFICVVAAFVVGCTMWQAAWLGAGRWTRFVLPLLLMLLTFYAVAGVRWYFGFVLWLATLPFFAIAAWRSGRRIAAGLTNAVVFLGLSQVIMFAAGPYVPAQLARYLGGHQAGVAPDVVTAVLKSRENFDKTQVNTMIEAGPALQKVDEPGQTAVPATKPQPASAVPAAKPVDEPSQTAVPATKAQPPAAVPAVKRVEESRQTAHPATTNPQPAAAVPAAKRVEESRQTARPATKAQPPAAVPAVKRVEESRQTVHPVTNPQPAAAVPAAKRVEESRQTAGPATKAQPPAAVPAVKRVEESRQIARPATTAQPGAAALPASPLPQSTLGRLVAGLSAVTLPRFIGQRLGVIHIGGGRGLWAMVETDTLVFDALLLITIYYVARRLNQGLLLNPSFWLVAITTAGITILLAYTISNFGTLFRHRAMIFTGLCLMLVVARETPRDPLPNDVSSEP